jgi:2-dehydropantoate 2-reductase
MFQNKKTKIAIAGMGGIGGYLGGKLAHYYADQDLIDIIFITRGETLKQIKQSGLELTSKEIHYRTMPTLVSNDPDEIGTIDLLIICTKTFSTTELLLEYQKCLSSQTTVITLQNTINGKEFITPLLPEGASLMEGCIYIASNKTAPNKVLHSSGPANVFFGTEKVLNPQGATIAKILNYAGIEADYTRDISTLLWKKFLFVSPAAIVTALYQITFTEILESRESEYLYIHLMSELIELGKAQKIFIDPLTVLNNIQLLSKFKGNVKSSFQIDLEQHRPTEIYSLVAYPIEQGLKLDVAMPYYQKAWIDLKSKYNL